MCALIGAYVDSMRPDDSKVHKSENPWQVMLSDAYEKKCKVLMAMGQYSSAVHFGRLSAVLDTGEFNQLCCGCDVIILSLLITHFHYYLIKTSYCCNNGFLLLSVITTVFHVDKTCVMF